MNGKKEECTCDLEFEIEAEDLECTYGGFFDCMVEVLVAIRTFEINAVDREQQRRIRDLYSTANRFFADLNAEVKEILKNKTK